MNASDFRLGILTNERLAWRGLAGSVGHNRSQLTASSLPHVIGNRTHQEGLTLVLLRLRWEVGFGSLRPFILAASIRASFRHAAMSRRLLKFSGGSVTTTRRSPQQVSRS